MKNKKSFAALAAAVLFTLIFVVVQSCQKTNDVRESAVTGLDDESTAVRQHILAFKAKMEYYRQNPDLKSTGTNYTADSATIEIESLINFDFCYTNIECNQKTFVTSEVTMPLDEYDSINDPGLMDVYYDKVIDTVQAQMGRVNYTNMKLLLVDLEHTGTNSNGDAIIKVGSLIGNEGTVLLDNDSWWYGKLKGNCSFENPGTDAAKQLEKRVTNAMLPDPPSGCRWYYTYIDTILLKPTDYQIDPVPDNFEDYKIYYASDDVADGLTFDVKCLSSDEMTFYKNHYINLATGIETQYGKYFNSCLINGRKYLKNNVEYIQHDYQLHIGHRYAECSIVVGDILEYE